MEDKKTKKQSVTPLASDRLELLITIVQRKKADYFMDLIQSFEVNMQFAIHGEGTAKAEMLDMLGLDDSDKAIIISVIREDKVSAALGTLEQKMKTIKGVSGIAYTVSLSSLIGTSVFSFLTDNRSSQRGVGNVIK